jgi:hypothetical protein
MALLLTVHYVRMSHNYDIVSGVDHPIFRPLTMIVRSNIEAPILYYKSSK